MAWMMDTSVAIYLRDGTEELIERVAGLGGDPVMSIVSQVELEGGVYRDPSQTARRRVRLDALLEAVTILPFDEAAAQSYRGIVAVVGFSRTRILDRMIAAQALASGMSLVTTNGADFRDVPGLHLEAWKLSLSHS